jgi:hypothetical protein
MKRLLVPLMVLVLLAVPMVIPTVSVTNQNNATTTTTAALATNIASSAPMTTAALTNIASPPSATTSGSFAFAIPLTSYTVDVSPGGNVFAWNLLYEMCRWGCSECCDLYSDGIGILW